MIFNHGSLFDTEILNNTEAKANYFKTAVFFK